jgi:1-acyl-sn-glycerol-3-phosphate acyltransferase
MRKWFLRLLDGTFGVVMRDIMYQIIRPFVAWRYPVTIEGGDAALSCKQSGAIVVANHHSMEDGPLLMILAWPYARLRATAKYSQYMRMHFRWAMVLFGVIRLGSPRSWTPEQREAEKAFGLETMSKVLAKKKLLLVFASGQIGDGVTEVIDPRYSGIYTMIKEHPGLPVLLVKHHGLHTSLQNGGLLGRVPVNIAITRFDNVSLDGGPAGLNRRLEQFFNEGIPLAVKSAAAA